MKWSAKGTILIGSLLIFQPAVCGISPKMGSFEWDRSIKLEVGRGQSLHFRLDYSSRRVFRGLFGQGWCSDLDVRLNRTTDDRYFFVRCGDVEEIKSATRFTDAQGTKWAFDGQGRISTISKNGMLVTVDHSQKDRVSLLLQSQRYEFFFDGVGPFISRLDKHALPVMEFIYQEDRLARTSRPGGKDEENYQYDMWNNMTQLQQQGVIKYQLQYDTNFDRVTALTTGPCTINLDYLLSQKIIVAQSCASVPVYTKAYEL